MKFKRSNICDYKNHGKLLDNLSNTARWSTGNGQKQREYKVVNNQFDGSYAIWHDDGKTKEDTDTSTCNKWRALVADNLNKGKLSTFWAQF